MLVLTDVHWINNLISKYNRKHKTDVKHRSEIPYVTLGYFLYRSVSGMCTLYISRLFLRIFRNIRRFFNSHHFILVHSYPFQVFHIFFSTTKENSKSPEKIRISYLSTTSNIFLAACLYTYKIVLTLSLVFPSEPTGRGASARPVFQKRKEKRKKRKKKRKRKLCT